MSAAQHAPVHAAHAILALLAAQCRYFFNHIKRNFAAVPEDGEAGMFGTVIDRIIAPDARGYMAPVAAQ